MDALFRRVCFDACCVGVIFVVVVLELDVWLYVGVVAVLRLVLRHVLMRMEVYFCVMIVLIEPGVASSRSYDTLLLFLYRVFNFRK